MLVNGGSNNTIDGNFIGTSSGGTPFTENTGGVRILGGSGNTFSNNRISSSAGSMGVQLAGGANTFTGNTIDHNAEGFQIVSAANVISGNTISASTGQGLELGTTAETISNNHIVDNGSAGIDGGDATGSTITGNTITGNGPTASTSPVQRASRSPGLDRQQRRARHQPRRRHGELVRRHCKRRRRLRYGRQQPPELPGAGVGHAHRRQPRGQGNVRQRALEHVHARVLPEPEL